MRKFLFTFTAVVMAVLLVSAAPAEAHLIGTRHSSASAFGRDAQVACRHYARPSNGTVPPDSRMTMMLDAISGNRYRVTNIALGRATYWLPYGGDDYRVRWNVPNHPASSGGYGAAINNWAPEFHAAIWWSGSWASSAPFPRGRQVWVTISKRQPLRDGHWRVAGTYVCSTNRPL